MQNKFILTDGRKSISLLNSDDPSVWTYFSNAPQSDNDVLYARVAAAFRAYNMIADTVGSVPFSLQEMASKKEIDSSQNWENKVGFLPNPQELFRLNVLSYITTNTIYNLRTSDILGYKTKNLLHAVASTFRPYINSGTMQLEYIERMIGSTIEIYAPDDKRLVRMWRLDHTTEVLPSPNTIAKAIMAAAGVIFYADTWIRHFYESGGVPPTVVAMKGAVSPEKQDTEGKAWDNFFMRIRRFAGRMTRVINADALEVKQLGSSITDLKNNEVYRQALENIAMGPGMPLSLLLSNSANMATATIEERQFYKNTITPIIRWMQYEYNEQVFHPINLHLIFNTSTIDAQQEEDAVNAETAQKLLDLLMACPSNEMFIAIAKNYLDLNDELLVAAEKYYADKEKQAEQVRQQMQSGDITQTPDGKPVQQKPEAQPPANAQSSTDTQEQRSPAKFVPSLDQLRELQRWQELAFRKLKRAEPMDFDWRNDTLPEEVYNSIKAGVRVADTEEIVKQVFDLSRFSAVTEISAPEYKTADDSAIKELAVAINKLADANIQKAGDNA